MTSHAPLLAGELKLIGGLNERLFSLLAAINSTGSISQAARDIGITYKGAWEMIERANNLSPKVLVATAVGGKQGGGTQLTETGQVLLKVFLELQAEHRKFLIKLNQKLDSNQEILFLLRRLEMKVSARNQYFGTVTHVTAGAVNAEVCVDLKGGNSIVAQITTESVNALGVQRGTEVVALIKAPQIILVTDFAGYRLSARNQLTGAVSRIQKGAVTAEVIVELKGGDSIAATITNDSLETLGLALGSPATAVFKASSVILGVAG